MVEVKNETLEAENKTQETYDNILGKYSDDGVVQGYGSIIPSPPPLKSRPEGMCEGEKKFMNGIAVPTTFLLLIMGTMIVQNYVPYVVDKRIERISDQNPKLASCVSAFYDANLMDRLDDPKFTMFDDAVTFCAPGTQAAKVEEKVPEVYSKRSEYVVPGYMKGGPKV